MFCDIGFSRDTYNSSLLISWINRAKSQYSLTQNLSNDSYSIASTHNSCNNDMQNKSCNRRCGSRHWVNVVVWCDWIYVAGKVLMIYESRGVWLGSNSSSPCASALLPSETLSVQALASLLLIEENRKLFLAEDWGIIGLVLLLDTRLQEVRKQFPVAALQALAGNAKCRKQMVTAGACYHLRLLSDMEVRGAKRLLDRLVTGKLRNMLSKTLLVSIGNCTLTIISLFAPIPIT